MVLQRTKNGKNTCRIKDQLLHSSYDPVKEAQRFLSKISFQGKNIVFIFEPGLGYLIPLIEEVIDPKCRIIVCAVNKQLYDYRTTHNLEAETLRFSLDSDLNVIQSIVNEGNYKRVQMVTWPQSSKIFNKEYTLFLRILNERLQQCAANHLHNRYMGQRRIRNSLRFMKTKSRIYKIKEIQGDILLVGPGPSLEFFSKELKELNKNLIIASLPSAVAFLKDQGVRIDLIFSSDPGFWASLHYRNFEENCNLVFPVDSYKDINRFSCPLIPVETVNPLSHWLDTDRIPEGITVAAFALDYLLSKAQGSIYLLGLDLGFEDIKQYARPHSFDRFHETQTFRLNSLHHIHFTRKAQSTGQGREPLRLFEESIYRLCFPHRDRIFTVSSSPINRRGIEHSDFPVKAPPSEIKKESLKKDPNRLDLDKIVKMIKVNLENHSFFPFDDPFCYLLFQSDPDFFTDQPYDRSATKARLSEWSRNIKDYVHEL